MHYLTIQEVAEILKVHTNTVYKMCRQGVLPAVKIGKEWRIDKDKLAEFMEEGFSSKKPATVQALLRSGIKPGHILGLFQDEDAIWEFESEIFHAVSAKGYRLLKACWWQRPDDVRQKLANHGIPVEEKERTGEMVVLDLNETFCMAGPVAAAEAWKNAAASAISRGFKGLVGSGSPSFDCCGSKRALMEFEGALDRVVKEFPVMGICSYAMDREAPSDLGVIVDLLETHDRFFIRSPKSEVVGYIEQN